MGTIRSMTGYGTSSRDIAGKRLTTEVRSVNGRFLEAQLRLPRLLQPLEGALREALSGKVGRGSLTVSVQLDDLGQAAALPEDSRLKRLADELRVAARAAGFGGDAVQLSDVLRWAQVRRAEPEAEPSCEGFRAPLLATLAEALAEFDGFRQREGAALEADLRARLGRIEEALARIPPLAKAHLENWREQLRQRIRELAEGLEPDPARIALEVAHMADKLDIDEEMTRFSSHNAQFRSLLDQGGTVGKRLGFLLQEMLRETNTTGSKCQNAEIAHLVVAIKDEIESLKEQIANLE